MMMLLLLFKALEFQLLLRAKDILGRHLAHLHLLKRKYPLGLRNFSYSLIYPLLILMLHSYAIIVHGFIGKWNFLMRCIPNTEDFLAPLEAII